MADSPPVTRKRGRHNDGDRAVTRDRRNAGSDWRESARNARQEEQEKVIADKRKKLIRAIPTTIPGVSAVVRGDARSDIREIEALADMQVLEPEDIAPGAVQSTPRPPMPKANQLEPKRARMMRWQKDPSEMEKDMAKQREALARAEKEDAQLEAERDAWERWYLVLRAHLTATRRPTVAWSTSAAAAAATAAAATAAAAAAAAAATAAASATSSANASSESAASGAESDSAEETASAAPATAATAAATAAAAAAAAEGGDGGGGGGAGEGGRDAGCGADGRKIGGAVLRAGGEEEEEEGKVRGLQAVVMNRAGLEGEFDMKKVLDVLAGCSREAMSARREHGALIARQQSKGGKGGKKDADNSEVEHEGGQGEAGNLGDRASSAQSAHPGDEESLRRWEELLRSVDVTGGRWRSDVSGRVADVPSPEELAKTDSDRYALDVASPSSSSRPWKQKQQPELLVPRGFDLLPSMRAPRHLPRSVPATTDDGGGGGSGTAAGREAAGTIEYVPWIGGSAGVGGAARTGQASGAASSEQRIEEVKARVQWFPRGLPKEATPVGRGQDERESALLNTRASMAIDRLGEQVHETRKRQAELEVKRRQKVEEATRLVRGAAEHEKLRQKHFRRMKELRAQLESLEGTKKSSSAEEEASDEGEKDEQGEEEEEEGGEMALAGDGSDIDEGVSDEADAAPTATATAKPRAGGAVLGGGGVEGDDDDDDVDDDNREDNDGDSDGDSDVPVSSANGGSPAGDGKPKEAGAKGGEVGSSESKTAPGSPSSPPPSPTPAASTPQSSSSREMSPGSAEAVEEAQDVTVGVSGSAVAAGGLPDKPEGRGEAENGEAMQDTGDGSDGGVEGGEAKGGGDGDGDGDGDGSNGAGGITLEDGKESGKVDKGQEKADDGMDDENDHENGGLGGNKNRGSGGGGTGASEGGDAESGKATAAVVAGGGGGKVVGGKKRGSTKIAKADDAGEAKDRSDADGNNDAKGGGGGIAGTKRRGARGQDGESAAASGGVGSAAHRPKRRRSADATISASSVETSQTANGETHSEERTSPRAAAAAAAAENKTKASRSAVGKRATTGRFGSRGKSRR